MALLGWLPRSLKGRLLGASFALLPVIIAVAGYALQDSYAYSLESALERRLRLQAYLMIGAAEQQDNQLVIPKKQDEARLGQETCGLIHNHFGLLQWASATCNYVSADVVSQAGDTKIDTGETRFRHLHDDHLYLYQYPVKLTIDQQERRYLFSVIESDQTLYHDLNAYRTQLAGWLFAVTLLALMLQTLITRWGLRPLTELVNDLHRIERGESNRLAGSYPEEVQGVTDSLNQLLHSERSQRERYRNTLGDLAHSLKTPLAVIRGAATENLPYAAYRSSVEEQIKRMDQIVQYQLARAVRTPTSSTTSHSTALAPVIQRICAALGKVYREKAVDCQLVLDDGALFGADERDLMELLGNLLENAFKYCHSQVRVSLSKNQEALLLNIEDDGPGISPKMRHVILQRGARADTSAAPGQGIGLTVAVDILSSYDGQLEVASSSLGGARFSITLPLG